MVTSPSPLGDLAKKKRSVLWKYIGLFFIVMSIGSMTALILWMVAMKYYPQQIEAFVRNQQQYFFGKTEVPPPLKPPQPVSTPPPQQETASAASPCCCPCPQKAKAAAHPKKKKVQQPRPAPPVTSQTAVASGTKGCVEIHFTTKPGDTVVKFPVIGPVGSNIAKDSCTAVKRAGDSTFGPWQNEFCPTAPSILCDFSEHERIIGQKIRLMGSYRIEKQGEHSLRLPGFIAGKESGYVTALVLVRGKVEQPKYPSEQPGDTKAFVAASKYGEQRQEWIANNSDAIGVRWFDYINGAARVYYSKSEVPKDVAQLYWPWGEWRGP